MQITISNLEIPIKIVKKNIVLAISSIKMLKFIRNLKLAGITPLYKKGKKDIKRKYRPVSILLSLSKIFLKKILKQILHLKRYQCGFRKGFSTQHCLLAMLENWKRSADDNGKDFGAFLTDLWKPFDSLNHELLIAKPNAYGFSLTAL